MIIDAQQLTFIVFHWILGLVLATAKPDASDPFGAKAHRGAKI